MNREQLDRIRSEVSKSFAEAKQDFDTAMQADGSNVLTWHGAQFWVDRVRHLVIPDLQLSRVPASAWTRMDSLPGEDEDVVDLMEVYGGKRQLADAGMFVRFLASFVAKEKPDFIWQVEAAKLLNLAVAQPSINPAFGSLFWLALADELGPREDSSANFFDLIETMIYAQIHYPSLVPAASDVRLAQIAFLERLFPGSTTPACETMSDIDWAEICSRQLQTHQEVLDRQLFAHIYARTGSLS
jgi:hypothetical protein